MDAIAQLGEELANVKASQVLLPELLSQLKRAEIEKIGGRQLASTGITYVDRNTGF